MREMSLGRPTILLLLGRACGYPLVMLNAVVIARSLGTDALGAYAYAMGLAGVFGLLPSLGLSTVVTRAVARESEDTAGIVTCALRAQRLLAVVVLILVPVAAASLPQQPVSMLMVILAAAQLGLGSLSWPYLAVLSGHGRYDRVALAEFGAGLGGTVCVLLAALRGDVVAFLAAHVAAAFLSVAVARCIAGPLLPSRSAVSFPLLGLLRQGLPFGLVALTQSMYTRLDVVLLGQMATRASLGLYTASYRPVNMVVSVGATLAGTLFPLMARSSPGGTPVAFTRAVRGASVIAPAVALGLSGAGALVLRLLFGDEFAAGAPVLTLLAWSAVANWWYAPIAVTLQATGHERAWLSCLLVGILVNAGANAWAIPQWGAVGAAGATLASEWLLLLLGVGLMSRLQSIRLPGRPVAVSVLAITVGAAVLLASHGLGPWFSTAAALGAYTAATIACRSVTMDDVRMVVGWMGERRRQ